MAKQNDMTEKEILLDINTNLRKLIGITAIHGKTEEKQTKILKSLGFKYEDISNITGIAIETLKKREYRSKIKKKR